MITSLIGKKLGQTQGFLEDGTRIPMTRIMVAGNVVSQIKTQEKDGYEAVQLGFGATNKANKPTTGHSKKAGLTSTPRFFRETKADKIESIELGSEINPEEVLSAGDIIDVSGTSKGKGYAGVVKRHHFKGGPKTHGQSDRHRAPGSIGQSTTPGRVYKGKRMAGRMGNEQVTVKNLEVIDFVDGVLLVKGLVPGAISSVVTITRRGENKKHMGLYKAPVAQDEVIEDAKVEEIGLSVEEQEEMRKEAEVKAAAEEIAQKEAEATDKAEKVAAGKAEEALVEKAKDEEKVEETTPAEAVAEETATEETNEEKEEAAAK